MSLDTKIGFIGHPECFSDDQKDRVKEILSQKRPKELHHGDRSGEEAEIHEIAKNVGGIEIHVHPPISRIGRAYATGEKMYPPKESATQLRDIVDPVTILLVCPKEYDGDGATGEPWAAVRYARKKKKNIYIILPDGTLEKEGSTK